MKKLSLALLVFFLLLSPLCYADPVGDVAAPHGKLAVSMGYYYDNQTRGYFSHDVKWNSHQLYAEGAFGFAERWDAFARIGNATVDTNAADGATFKDSFNPYISLGVRGNIATVQGVDVGLFGKLNYYGDWEDAPVGTVKIKIKENYDFMVGVTGKVNLQNNISLYGGPLFFYAQSKLNIRGANVDVDADSHFGALIGIKFPFRPNISFSAESQYKAEKLSFGLFASYLF